jgi:hypothetical protein
MSSYEWPPEDTEKAEKWSSEHPLDAIAYAAGWSASGMGYGKQARKEWPDNPGFDFTEGLPDWDTGLKEDPDYEYRTVLMSGDPYLTTPDRTDDGWEQVTNFAVNPEPELFDEEGSASGHMYIGEGHYEIVYRRDIDWDDEPHHDVRYGTGQDELDSDDED